MSMLLSSAGDEMRPSLGSSGFSGVDYGRGRVPARAGARKARSRGAA